METITFDIQSITTILRRFGSFFVFLWLILIAAILLDLWDGVHTARKMNEPIKSHRLRVTIQKITEYWRLMLIAALVDSVGALFTFYNIPYLSILFCLCLVGVEAKSMFEHAKRRKSRTVEMKDILGIIIRAVNDKDADNAYRKIREYIGTIDNKGHEEIHREKGD